MDQLSLVSCGACGAPIAIHATACPRCGAPHVHPRILAFREEKFPGLFFQRKIDGLKVTGTAVHQKLFNAGVVLLVIWLILFFVRDEFKEGLYLAASNMHVYNVLNVHLVNWLARNLAFYSGWGLIAVSLLRMKRFEADFSTNPPAWTSNDNVFWQAIRTFLVGGDSVTPAPTAPAPASATRSVHMSASREDFSGSPVKPSSTYGVARKLGAAIARNTSSTSSLGNRLAKWFGIGLVGIVLFMVGVAVLEGISPKKAPDIAPSAVSQSPHVPVAPVVPVPEVGAQQSAAVTAAVAAANGSDTPKLSQLADEKPSPAGAKATVEAPAVPLPIKNTARPVESKELVTAPPAISGYNGTWSGTYNCGPYTGSRKPANPESFSVAVSMAITGKEVELVREGQKYKEVLRGQITSAGKLTLKGEGMMLAAPDKPWTTHFAGGVREGRITAAGEIVGIDGAKVRDCQLTLQR